MFRFYNAHPRKLSVDDCVKRSIALTTGIPYAEVQRGLNGHKKITGAKSFNSHRNPESYMEKVLGFAPVRVAQRGVTVQEFAESHTLGRYVISVREHWTACIDGIIYDTWDCGGEEVLEYFAVTRFTKIPVEKKYCFTVVKDGAWRTVTVYDGNGRFASRQLTEEGAREYIEELYGRGFFNFDEMGEYI